MTNFLRPFDEGIDSWCTHSPDQGRSKAGDSKSTSAFQGLFTFQPWGTKMNTNHIHIREPQAEHTTLRLITQEGYLSHISLHRLHYFQEESLEEHRYTL